MAGERSGKSYTGAAYGVVKDLHIYTEQPERKRLIWIVGKDYESCLPEFRGGNDSPGMVQFLEQLGLLHPAAKACEGCSLQIREDGRDRCVLTTHNGLRVETVTGGEPYKIARMAPDVIIGAEVGTWSELLFQRVVGRLAEKRGWLWASGSFEQSTGWLVDTHHRWQAPNDEDGVSFSIRSWENKVIYPGGYEDPEMRRLRAMYPEYLFQQRFAGLPSQPKGLVFSDFTSEHISREAVYDPDRPVQVWIDPGFKSAYAVLAVQLRGDVVDVIDEIYEQDKTSQEIISIAMRRPWWRPHRGVIDVAGTQHHAARSAEEVWREAGVRLSYQKLRVEDSIDRVRSLLRARPEDKTPQLRVNPSCRGLISEMGQGPVPFAGRGPWAYKLDRAGNIMSDVPDERNNDACKALAYGLVDNFGYVEHSEFSGAPPSYLRAQGASWLEASAEPSDTAVAVAMGLREARTDAQFLCRYGQAHVKFQDAVRCTGGH